MDNTYENNKFYRNILTEIKEANEKMDAVLKEGNEVYSKLQEYRARMDELKQQRRDLENYMNQLTTAARYLRKDDARCMNEEELFCIGRKEVYYSFDYEKEQ